MIIREEYLIKINAKNKIQRVKVSLDKHVYSDIYTIYRVTGQYGGKETEQPLIFIETGRGGRTTLDQAGLQFAHILTEYLNSGYKKLSTLTSKKYDELTEEELKSLLDTGGSTDTKGIPKPMLAKSSNDLANNIFDKDVYVSRKLDGVRMLMYYKDGIILTASRGGKNYNIATSHLRNDPVLLSIFHTDPTLILDGELYKHGWPLQKISGLARLQTHTEECDQLEYWVYDYVSKQPFKERYENLVGLRNLIPEDSKIKIIEQKLMSGWLKIKKEHDKYVQEGFEGLCARNPEKEYGIGKRSGLYLWKLKMRDDGEFPIVGVREGLRDEDMCFVLKTQDGKEFAAKPACDAETRKYYLEHKDEFIGKMGTCTFFNYSKDGIPTQPVFKFIREEEDLPQ